MLAFPLLAGHVASFLLGPVCRWPLQHSALAEMRRSSTSDQVSSGAEREGQQKGEDRVVRIRRPKVSGGLRRKREDDRGSAYNG